MLHEAKVYNIVGHSLKQAFVPLPGSAFAFLVVPHLPAALELRTAGSGLDLEACMQLLSLLKATLGKHVATCTVNRSWEKPGKPPSGFTETPSKPLVPMHEYGSLRVHEL